MSSTYVFLHSNSLRTFFCQVVYINEKYNRIRNMGDAAILNALCRRRSRNIVRSLTAR